MRVGTILLLPDGMLSNEPSWTWILHATAFKSSFGLTWTCINQCTIYSLRPKPWASRSPGFESPKDRRVGASDPLAVSFS